MKNETPVILYCCLALTQHGKQLVKTVEKQLESSLAYENQRIIPR